MTTTKQITSFEVIDHGIDHCQYFQGCGTSYTEFDECVTGCGESAADAFDDALEQIASSGDVSLKALEESEDNVLFTSDKAKETTVSAHLASQGEEPGEECELYYYVSIRYSVEGSAE